MKVLFKLAINAVALWVVSYLIPGFFFASVQALIVTAIVFGIVNTFIRPVLQIITLPISIVTFGIAAFLINVLLLWLVSLVVPGFNIVNFWTAVLASIVLSLTSWFLHKLASD